NPWGHSTFGRRRGMGWLRDVPGFGALVDGLTWAISHFDNKDLAFAIAFAILVVALGIWAFLYLRRHRPWLRPIRRLSTELRKLRGDNLDARARLAQADGVFASEPALASLWWEYRKNLKPTPQADGFLNLIDPRLWFSVESLPGRGYEQWCATWAGVFLTVGLLFTFIGLSAALLKVSSINGADSAAMKAAITGILGVSSAKFITSIAGLLAYIGFSLVTRHYQSIQHATARDLADAVQHLSLPLAPELLLYEQNETARRQLTRSEHLADDLAVAIDKKLEQRLKALAADFGHYLGALQQDLSGATAAPIVDAIQNMSETVAQQFSKQIQQATGGEVNTVAERFTAVAAELARVKDGMGGAGEAFGDDIRKAAADLREAAGKMGQGLDSRSRELEETIGQFGGKLDNISSTLGRVPDSIDRALNATLDKLTGVMAVQVQNLDAMGQTFTTAGQTVTGASNALQQATQPLLQTATTMRTNIDQIRQGVAEATAIQQQTSQAVQLALDGLKRAADAAERTFKTHADRFGHADEALANALSRLRDGVEQVTKATQGVFAEYETHITSAVGSLSAVAGELQETVEELAALRRPLPG
ncbi:MAG: hypothetical protein ACOYB3_12115, partial [Azonexus sp.]